MQFPLYQFPWLGNGMVIGVDAVAHVVISHGVAIGVFSMIVLAEYLGMRRGSAAWDALARDLLRASVLVITGVGAILGVGIWVVTSALVPRGIGSLLRVFFWPWFIEWFAFTGEVILLLVYYFTWERWSGPRKRQHLGVGVGYLVFGWASAFLITGILGFMLTPDGWPATRGFWGAFFNPTFLPQLCLRLAAAYAMGGVFAVTFVVFTRHEVSVRRDALRLFGRVALGAAAATGLCAWWYLGAVPARYLDYAPYAVLGSRFSQATGLLGVGNAAAGGAILLLALAATVGATRTVRLVVLPTCVACALFVAEFERTREFIRGPYVMPGYMYANQVLLAEQTAFNRDGALSHSPWYQASTARPTPISAGRFLFGLQCAACHTVGGINDIGARVQGRTEDGIAAILAHTHEMVPFMPPFAGTRAERLALAHYLFQSAAGGPAAGSPARFVPGP